MAKVRVHVRFSEDIELPDGTLANYDKYDDLLRDMCDSAVRDAIARSEDRICCWIDVLREDVE